MHNIKPFSQFDLPSMTKVSTTSTPRIITVVFIEPKTKSIGCPKSQPTMTVKGTTKSAIWVDEPTAMPMDNPNRSCIANLTALACSQALPAKGSTMMPMKSSGMPQCFTTSSIALDKNSEEIDTNTVVTAMRRTAAPALKPPSSSSSSSSSEPWPSSKANIVLWVCSWNTMYATYANMMMTAPILDTSTTLSRVSSRSLSAAKTVGNAQVMHASSCIAMFTRAFLLEKNCSFSKVHRAGL
mmetsp:Transcript_22847/g.64884  ORF Transcript_22847/g.64884 Transcript_22847/m.64884 type:complete len:240 (+) Transcript_22847:247-966(+)